MSPRVRLKGIVGFVSVVGITLVVLGDLLNYEKIIEIKIPKSKDCVMCLFEHTNTCHP